MGISCHCLGLHCTFSSDASLCKYFSDFVCQDNQHLCNSCAGAAGKPVSVLFAGSSSSQAVQDPAVGGLIQWGYPMQRLKGDSDAAHQDLFARLAGQYLQLLP